MVENRTRRQKTVWILLVTLLTGCGGVSFSHSDGSSTSTANTAGETNPGSSTSQTTQTGSLHIQVLWSAKICVPANNNGPGTCLFTFALQNPLPEPYSFNWRTDDTAYLSAAPSGAPPYGKPGHDYQISSGTVLFLPNTTSAQTIDVPDLNTGTAPFTVRIIEDNCLYDGSAEFADCSTDIKAGGLGSQ